LQISAIEFNASAPSVSILLPYVHGVDEVISSEKRTVKQGTKIYGLALQFRQGEHQSQFAIWFSWIDMIL